MQEPGEAGDIFGDLLCLIEGKQFCGGPPRRIISEIDMGNCLPLGITHNETCGPLFGRPRGREVAFRHLKLQSITEPLGADARGTLMLREKMTAHGAQSPRKLLAKVNVARESVPARQD